MKIANSKKHFGVMKKLENKNLIHVGVIGVKETQIRCRPSLFSLQLDVKLRNIYSLSLSPFMNHFSIVSNNREFLLIFSFDRWFSKGN